MSSPLKWFEKPLRILDFIPPGPGKYEKVDIAAEMKHRAGLGFNAEHLEVMDIASGASGIFYPTQPLKSARIC